MVVTGASLSITRMLVDDQTEDSHQAIPQPILGPEAYRNASPISFMKMRGSAPRSSTI